MCAVVWLAVLAAGLLACGDKGTGPSTPGRVVLDVRYADPGAAAAAKAVAALRMDRMAAMAQQNGATVRQQELSYEAGTWKGTLKLPSGTYRIAVEAFKADRVRWRGQTSVTLAGGRTVTAVIELASTNRAPVLTGIGDQQVTEGGTLRLGLSASDADEDELTYSMSGYPSGASLNQRTFTWTPTHDQAGTYRMTFTVSDGQGGSDQETITITVTVGGETDRTNRAPVLTAIGDRQVAEGGTLRLSLSASDADGDDLTFAVSGQPAGASLAGNTFTWTPTHDQAGTYRMTFTVSDGQGGSDQETITITVTSVGETGSGTSTNTPPAAPANISFVRDGTSTRLTWDAVPGADYYKIYYDDFFDNECKLWANGRLSFCEELASRVTGTNYVHTSPDHDTNYYWVTACNSGGCSDIDSENPATFIDTRPGAPTNVRYVRDGASIRLTWDAVSGADYYKIYHDDFFSSGCRLTSSGRTSFCEELASRVTGTSYVHTNPDDDTNYYWVTACNSGGCSDIDSENPAGAG